MRKGLILLLIATFLLAIFSFMVSADTINIGDYFITAEQNSCFNIPFGCDNCTFVNLTVAYPNGSIIISNAEMTSTDGFHYNYSFCNTSKLGKYWATYHYDEDGIYLYTDLSWFEITKTGYKQTESESIGSLSFLALIVALTFVFGLIGFKFLESDLFWVLGIFFIFLSLILVVYDFWLGVVYHQLYIGNVYESTIPQILFYIFFIAVVIGVIVAGLLLFKRIPSYIRQVFPFLKREDGWDENVFDKS